MKTKGNKLIFLGFVDEPMRLHRYLKRYCNDKRFNRYTVVSMNRFTDQLKESTGHDIAYFDNFLDGKDYEYIEDYAHKVAKSWYKHIPPKKNITECKGANTLKILELEAYILLCTMLRNLHVILNIIEKQKISEAIIIGEHKEDRLKDISIFLKTNFYIKVRYVNIGHSNLRNTLSKLAKNIKRFFINMLVGCLDRMETMHLTNRNTYKNAILIDFKLPHIIKTLKPSQPVIEYIVEHGLRTRIGFLKNKKPYFSFRKINRLFINIGEKRYFRYMDKRLNEKFMGEEALKYKSRNIYPALKNIFKYIITDRIPFLRRAIYNLYIFLKRINPKVIVLRDSVRTWECTLTLVAKTMNIPHIVIQHGIESLKGIYAEQNSDAMALWGEFYRDWYEESRKKNPKYEVTGYPMHDFIYTSRDDRSERYEKILRAINANPQKPTLIYLGNCIRYYPTNSVYVTPDFSLYALDKTLEAFKEFSKNVQLIIKLHPYYSRDDFPKFSKKAVGINNVFFIENVKIPDLFSGSIAVISELLSSAIVDAIILKKPVIFYNFTKRDNLIPLQEKGVGLEIRNPEDITPSIKMILERKNEDNLFSDKNFESFISEYAYKIDGKSTERVLKTVERLLLNER